MTQLSRTDLNNNANTRQPNNVVGAIDPVDTRQQDIDLADSSLNILTDDTDDLNEGISNLYFTDTRVYTKVKALLAAGTNVTITANDGAQTLTIDAASGGISDGDKGDITVSGAGTVWTIDNEAITLAKIQNIATNRVLARSTAGVGSVEELTLPDFRTLINVEDGADVTDTANVTAAGAVMDSELTNEAAVKALNQGVATTDTPEFDGVLSYRPQGTLMTASANLDTITPYQFYDVNANAGAIVITVTDQANTDYPIGAEFEFSPIDLTNDVLFIASGAQTIDSLDGNLKLDGVFSGAVLRKTAADTWRLIGALKA